MGPKLRRRRSNTKMCITHPESMSGNGFTNKKASLMGFRHNLIASKKSSNQELESNGKPTSTGKSKAMACMKHALVSSISLTWEVH